MYYFHAALMEYHAVFPNFDNTVCLLQEVRANFTSDTWKTYIDTVAKDKENVEDIVVETMAKLLRRQIIEDSIKG
jgi:hypothetical protein